jgi:hypothetical protein
MATSWLKARTPLLASHLFLGCAFTRTESSDMSDTTGSAPRKAQSIAGRMELPNEAALFYILIAVTLKKGERDPPPACRSLR